MPRDRAHPVECLAGVRGGERECPVGARKPRTPPWSRILPPASVRSACHEGFRVRFFTAAALVNKLEEAHQHHQLDRLLAQLDRAELLIVDELGYLSFSRTGAELLFQVFAERYERRSLLLTSNLAFSEWGQVFQGERMTAALLDRLTHRCHIFEMQGESYRFREAMKEKGKQKAK